MRIVHVRWEDSHGSSGWVDRDDVDKWPLVINTVGYLFAKDKKTLSVASSMSKNGEFSGVTKIPRSCVIKIKVLKKRGVSND